MAAGDNPWMAHNGKVVWDKESSFGVASAAGTWNSFGYRVGDLRDLGPDNSWNSQRAWSGGPEVRVLDLLSQDYGGALGEFKLTDLRIPGFWWGQEPSNPVATGQGGFRHTLQPTINPVAPTKGIQVIDTDNAGTTYGRTAMACQMPEIELVGNEAGEITYSPTYIAQKNDESVPSKSVVEPTGGSYKHFHGSITVFGVQLLRVVSWRLRCVRGANRARFWSTANPRLAYEYPLEDASYVMSVRAVADGKQFPAFSSRNLSQMADNGDLGQAVLKWVRTAGVDEGQINIGSANDALGLISTPRVRPAAGGRVMYEMDLAARVSQYQWVDASNAKYFPA